MSKILGGSIHCHHGACSCLAAPRELRQARQRGERGCVQASWQHAVRGVRGGQHYVHLHS